MAMLAVNHCIGFRPHSMAACLSSPLSTLLVRLECHALTARAVRREGSVPPEHDLSQRLGRTCYTYLR